MTIQWYPGHMHKAQKEIKQSLPKVDIIVEVIDARIPFSSENPMIGRLRGDKPCIKVFSKTDLADIEVVSLWQEYFEKQKQVKTLPISIQEKAKILKIPDVCKKMLPSKAKGVKKIRAMIVGIPNVGKSTLINVLAGKAIAKTGNEPAVTKTQQFIHLNDDMMLLDTPGILWPKQEFEKSSYRLATTGAIKDTALEYEDIAFFAAEFLLSRYPSMLQERYALQDLPSSELEFLECIGVKRGALSSGGRVNLTKISELFIQDLRSGVIGPICMETPAMIESELKEPEAISLKKSEAKKNHKSKRRK